MTVAEAAAALRVSRATVYRLVHAGTPGTRPGRSMRVFRRGVKDYLRHSGTDGTDARTGPG
jgi:excisionase family DNA binding protein